MITHDTIEIKCECFHENFRVCVPIRLRQEEIFYLLKLFCFCGKCVKLYHTWLMDRGINIEVDLDGDVGPNNTVNYLGRRKMFELKLSDYFKMQMKGELWKKL